MKTPRLINIKLAINLIGCYSCKKIYNNQEGRYIFLFKINDREFDSPVTIQDALKALGLDSKKVIS